MSYKFQSYAYPGGRIGFWIVSPDTYRSVSSSWDRLSDWHEIYVADRPLDSWTVWYRIEVHAMRQKDLKTLLVEIMDTISTNKKRLKPYALNLTEFT